MTSEITCGLFFHIIYSRRVWNKQFYSTQISHVDYVYSSGLAVQTQDKPIAYLLESEQEKNSSSHTVQEDKDQNNYFRNLTLSTC
jgi:hypothetical protein